MMVLGRDNIQDLYAWERVEISAAGNGMHFPVSRRHICARSEEFTDWFYPHPRFKGAPELCLTSEDRGDSVAAALALPILAASHPMKRQMPRCTWRPPPYHPEQKSCYK